VLLFLILYQQKKKSLSENYYCCTKLQDLIEFLCLRSSVSINIVFVESRENCINFLGTIVIVTLFKRYEYKEMVYMDMIL
jgi:hypothetical protein